MWLAVMLNPMILQVCTLGGLALSLGRWDLPHRRMTLGSEEPRHWQEKRGEEGRLDREIRPRGRPLCRVPCPPATCLPSLACTF